MKHLIRSTLFLAYLILMSNCARGSISIVLKNGDTAIPLKGIRVDRYHPVSLFTKIFNPVSATYHPYRRAESKITSAEGNVIFDVGSTRDIYCFTVDGMESVEVDFCGKKTKVSPTGFQSAKKKWGCSVQVEDGKPKYSTWLVQ